MSKSFSPAASQSAMGSTDRERQRLMLQGGILRGPMEYGIATPEEVQIDTLGDRLFARAREVDPQWVGSRYILARARKP